MQSGLRVGTHAETSLSTTGSIIVLQRADNLVVCVGTSE